MTYRVLKWVTRNLNPNSRPEALTLPILQDIQSEWVIAHIEHAGNKINQKGEPQGLAEAMGVNVDQEYEYYDPYAMDGGAAAEAGQFASVGQDMAMFVQVNYPATAMAPASIA